MNVNCSQAATPEEIAAIIRDYNDDHLLRSLPFERRYSRLDLRVKKTRYDR